MLGRESAAQSRAQGEGFMVGGSITDRLRADPDDDLYLNPAAFSHAAAGTFGNAPRMLPGIYSPWRNSTDLAINKDLPLGGERRATLRLEIINLFDNPWYAAIAAPRSATPTSAVSAPRATTRGRCRSQRG